MSFTSSKRVGADSPRNLTSIHIEAFRGLSNIRLEKLGRINLLVGNNNAGKTSVLEAVSVLQNPLEPFSWYNVVRARELRSLSVAPDHATTLDALKWMFPARDGDFWGEAPPHPIEIQGFVGTGVNILQLKCEPLLRYISGRVNHRSFRDSNKELVEDRGLSVRAELLSSIGQLIPTENFQEWEFWASEGLRVAYHSRRSRDAVQFLAPYSHRNTPASLRQLSEAAKDNARGDINDLLSQLDPRIIGVEIITSADGRIPKIAMRMRDGSLVPQGVLGDGIRRALAIALAIRSAADGVLLIDEIEAALHVNALNRMYAWLEEAASAFNVQIFASTHSLEAIEAIIGSFAPNEHSDLSAYGIDDTEQHGVRRYTGGMLHRLVKMHGADIRF